jgi:hypothetical protein
MAKETRERIVSRGVVEGEMLQIKVRTKVRISRSRNDKRKREREGIKRSQRGELQRV